MLAAIHARRHLDAARSEALTSGDKNGDAEARATAAADKNARQRVEFDYGVQCDIRTARLLVADQLDERRILRLVYGLALLDHRAQPPLEFARATPDAVSPIFDVLAIAWMGHRLRGLPQESKDMLGPRPGWAARLAANAITPVVVDAVLRLRTSGQPVILTPRDLLAGSPSSTRLGPRLGAALLLPLGQADIREIADRITIRKPIDDKNQQRKETA